MDYFVCAGVVVAGDIEITVNLQGKYVVVGLGITGTAVIDFLISNGCEVVGFEELSEEAFKRAQEKFSQKRFKLYFRELPETCFNACRGFFVSPGVPLTRGWVDEARRKEIPILGELEWASRQLKGSILAVTGTNGKSTTVSLIQSILSAGGFNSALKGNIGSPLITALAEPPKDYYVVEVSSYQLETIETFHPRISVVLNVTPDHLERYASMEEYASAKERIFENQRRDDCFVYNADDPFCLKMANKAPCQKIPFSLVNKFPEGGFVDREKMVIRIRGEETSYSLNECSLSGLHNQENMLASLLTVHLVGVRPDIIRKQLSDFHTLPHRVQKIGVWKGITFYDDSKGTNVGAVVMSLASFEKNVILILGGRDKGGDYAPLKPLIREKTKGVIVLGEAREKICSSLSSIKPVYQVQDMREAVKLSYEIGEEGDLVLLSPACSSFDQYKNYAERGLDFQKWASHYGK